MSGQLKICTRPGGPGSDSRSTSGLLQPDWLTGNGRASPRVTHREITVEASLSDPVVWGKSPYNHRKRNDLIFLFAEQSRLKAVLRRQARLASLEVSEVCSRESEQLREVNWLITNVSLGVEGAKNPFASRQLTTTQALHEEMVRRGGKRFEPGTTRPKQSAPSVPALRKNGSGTVPLSKPVLVRLEDLLDLRGPLARDFSRSRSRGYRGTPSQWLRSAKAVACYKRLPASVKNRYYPESWSIFDHDSPLHWAVTSRSRGLSTNVHHGFQGERVRSAASNILVLRRQASLVPRLKAGNWPTPLRRGCSWPTYPTLEESWEMFLRSIESGRRILPIRTGHAGKYAVPTNQIKPGSSVRAVSQFVIGIRADIEVPRKFLAYFRYRWGFLILRRKAHLPKGLVDQIVHLWKNDFTSLMMSEPIRYNAALRRISPNSRWLLGGFLSAGPQGVAGGKGRKRPAKKERAEIRLRNLYPVLPLTTVNSAPSSDKSDDGVRLYKTST
jgi:hypothetical protein